MLKAMKVISPVEFNLSPRSDQILHIARGAWERHHGGQITPEHIAEGFAEVRTGVHFDIWSRTGFDIAAFQKANREWMRAYGQKSPPTKIDDLYSAAVIEMLAEIKEGSARMKHNFLSVHHLFIALLGADTPATNLMDTMGFDRQQARIETLHELNPYFDFRFWPKKQRGWLW